VKVQIPFRPEFREVMLNGIKTMTSRTKPFGKEGDTFPAFGAEFRLKYVFRELLRYSAVNWEMEGAKSKEDFIRIWNEIHPRKGFDPFQSVWVNIFEKIEGGGETKP